MSEPFALIVEDDPKLGAIFETALRQAGFETSLDADGNRWTTFLSKHKPDLVILDLHLPYASGTDILHQLRSDDHSKGIPVVVVTADIFLAKSMESQADFVLLKPVSIARLLEIVARLNIPGSHAVFN